MRSIWLAFAFAIMLVPVAACGGGGSGDDDDGGPVIDAPPAPIDAPFDPSVIETRSVQIGPVDVSPGEERTVCTVVDLGNTAPRMIRRVSSQLTAGTHHVIATLTSASPTGVLADCGPFAGGGADNGVLTIAQQTASSLTYPAGAGLPVAAHQSIHLEMHYINTTEETMPIGGMVFLDLADGNAALRPIDFVFTGNPSLNIPPMDTATVTSFHTLQAGDELFATTAHTHKYGLRATVELMASAGGPVISVLHDSTNWAERPLDAFPPIVITEGQGLRLTCNYRNDTNMPINFGLSAEEEMCFVWAHLISNAP
jgi:hypothetical protein